VTVVAGVELEGDEEFLELKAFSATLETISWMASALVSAFVSATIPIPSSTAAVTIVDTPGTPPGCQRTYLKKHN
jgi:hypothetical protein